MEFFNSAKVVRLRSHLDKFLLADEDQETVRQSRSGSSCRVRWTVEFVEGNSHLIRLKSCHGRYLTASDDPFLLGMTGKKVVQTVPARKRDSSVEWEPIREGFRVKLRTKGGNFLRANGGTPPWRNSVTHDVPHRTATQDWVLWAVDAVDISVMESIESFPNSHSPSPLSSFSSLPDDFSGPNSRSPSIFSDRSTSTSGRRNGMDLFDKAKAVRLRSHLGKYLVADDDEETVKQSREGSSRTARWTVEWVQGKSHVIRLKSCHGRYLTATNEHFLLGMTGKKVTQTIPATKGDTSIEWEPIKEGSDDYHLKLRSWEGKFLRANGGTPPWRNSITHDVPHRTATQDWVLWAVDVVDIAIPEAESESTYITPASSFSSAASNHTKSADTPLTVSSLSGHVYGRQSELPGLKRVSRAESLDSESSLGSFPPRTSKLESSESFDGSPMKSDGRVIYYSLVSKNGCVEEGNEASWFNFKGHGLKDLIEKLEVETGLQDIIVCSRNPLNGKLYPLRLQLPPNNASMRVVVIPSTSRG